MPDIKNNTSNSEPSKMSVSQVANRSADELENALKRYKIQNPGAGAFLGRKYLIFHCKNLRDLSPETINENKEYIEWLKTTVDLIRNYQKNLDTEKRTPDLDRLQEILHATVKMIKAELKSHNKPKNLTTSLFGGMQYVKGAIAKKATSAKDTVMNWYKKHATPKMTNKYVKAIGKLLTAMEVSPEIKARVMAKVRRARVEEHYVRTIEVLTVLYKHGVKKELADEFFNGAHFMLKDNGKLFNEIAEITGTESRFSSHFASTRIAEKGINCGRILPEVLIISSTDPETGKIRSHFQAEASPWRSGLGNYFSLDFLQRAEHIRHSTWYFSNKIISKVMGKPVLNLGPYGWSEHDDAHPIVDMKRPQKEMENADAVRQSMQKTVATGLFPEDSIIPKPTKLVK